MCGCLVGREWVLKIGLMLFEVLCLVVEDKGKDEDGIELVVGRIWFSCLSGGDFEWEEFIVVKILNVLVLMEDWW